MTKPKKLSRGSGALKRTIAKVKREAAQLVRGGPPTTLEEASTAFANICTYVSNLIGPDAPAANVANALATMKLVEKQSEAMKEYVREAAIRLLKEDGEEVGVKGTRILLVENWHLEMHRKNGVDPKKLEKLLREKGLDPANWMTPTVKYSVDPVKCEELKKQGYLGLEEVLTLAFDESWAVQSPIQFVTQQQLPEVSDE